MDPIPGITYQLLIIFYLYLEILCLYRLILYDTQVVPDSDRAYAFISGDVMAASLKNIGNLVRLPTGKKITTLPLLRS